jgi:hypothetical protein
VTNLVFNLVQADAAVVFANGLLPSGKVGASATVTIAQDRTHFRGFVAAT